MTLGFLDELRWRGLLHQTTATESVVQQHLATPGRAGYVGFDPTQNSLTIGNFIAIKVLMHFQRAGHRPIALVGGGTGLIGDPSGKDAERPLSSRSEVAANVEGQRRIFERFLDFGGTNAARLVDNSEWLLGLGYIEVLRDIGKHFSVNAMIQKDSVRERLHNREQGISYTEFSYMLLQAYDFLHLKQKFGCSLQISGSDQYGNIVGGIDLIHYKLGAESEAYGIVAPLLLGADGKKIGKTEKGAIWLTADRTSPYALYQYLLNVEDAEVGGWLKWSTFLSETAVGEILQAHEKAPQARGAQRALARELTTLIHGTDECSRAQAASEALFGGDVRALDERALGEVFADVPHSEHDKSALEGEGLALVELLPQTSLASSKSQARQFLQSGAVSVNSERVDADYRLTTRDLLPGARILLRRGKKQWHATVWRA